jgi:hypothetical protein
MLPQTRAWQSLGVRTRIPQWLSEKKSKWAVFPVMMYFANTQPYVLKRFIKTCSIQLPAEGKHGYSRFVPRSSGFA